MSCSILESRATNLQAAAGFQERLLERDIPLQEREPHLPEANGNTGMEGLLGLKGVMGLQKNPRAQRNGPNGTG